MQVLKYRYPKSSIYSEKKTVTESMVLWTLVKKVQQISLLILHKKNKNKLENSQQHAHQKNISDKKEKCH